MIISTNKDVEEAIAKASKKAEKKDRDEHQKSRREAEAAHAESSRTKRKEISLAEITALKKALEERKGKYQ